MLEMIKMSLYEDLIVESHRSLDGVFSVDAVWGWRTWRFESFAYGCIYIVESNLIVRNIGIHLINTNKYSKYSKDTD